MKQIICLSNTPWMATPNRTQQLLTRINDARILFIEPPPARGESFPQQGRRMREHIFVYTLPVSSRIPLLANRNLTFIKKVMEKHHFRSPVLWCTAPNQVGLAKGIACRGTIYDCTQEWDNKNQEKELAQRCEVVFTLSPRMAHHLESLNDNVAVLPDGTNSRMYQREDLFPPSHLAGLAGKIVFGCAEDITTFTDLTPLLAAAKDHRKWIFLLMGRVSKKVAPIITDYPNIRINGQVNAAELPEYFSACTAFFHLMRDDELGKDILPTRIYDYMATGKPVIMMAEPDYEEPFPEVIYTAYDQVGFQRRCEEALNENPMLVLSRQDCANKCSWSARAGEIAMILEATGLF